MVKTIWGTGVKINQRNTNISSTGLRKRDLSTRGTGKPEGGGRLAFGPEIVLSQTPSPEELCADRGQGSPGAWAQAGTLSLFRFF